jgi:hypothetical protein
VLFLVLSLWLLGVLIGAAAHLPPKASLVAGLVVGGWLVALALRERRQAHG